MAVDQKPGTIFLTRNLEFSSSVSLKYIFVSTVADRKPGNRFYFTVLPHGLCPPA